ncbi:hypothetical protein VB711_24720 [Cronbergia sp. UHCC 0137]|uniref:hypothetical protein n=1 Tax=Cronbergia sp. UHCC 0137 TaxID=3110239 RepID=UPI002B21ACAE|nr:hypothetical protein [Cronbergia sp. UHCC 0137]MEA5621013.1 hypothetical protein [Cronbergia sp. UHCC 0137]
MKSKLLNVLIVCVVMLAVLSPGILVFNLIWGRHIELVKTQNLSCEINKINKGIHDSYPQVDGANTSKYQATIKASNATVTEQIKSIVQEYKLATILQWLVLGTPIVVGLGIIAYDRYLVYRSAVLREQMEMLERLWQQSIEQ